jgi:hypothetical protein
MIVIVFQCFNPALDRILVIEKIGGRYGVPPRLKKGDDVRVGRRVADM